MSQVRKILFSVNEYDFEGDCTDKGIFLHFDNTRVKVADSLKEFREIIPHLESMAEEIESNYPEVQP